MKSILLKLSGEIFKKASSDGGAFSLQSLIKDIKKLSTKYKIGIVIGGGNIFRGSIEGKKLGLDKITSDYAGMIATVVNGLILQNFLEKNGVTTSLFSSIEIPKIAQTLNQKNIDEKLKEKNCLIFVCGVGKPSSTKNVTTDSAAVMRALQIDADIILKGTKVDGVYTDDPKQNPNATILKKVTYDQILDKNLKVVDLNAITLAKKHNVKIKVFDIFAANALQKALINKDFGSTISN